MTFVVAEPCIKCKYTDCVASCPVDAFHEAENMLVINPEECIDCNACVPECPIEAIISDRNLPEDKAYLLDLNRELSEILPVITEQKEPMPDADVYAVEEKTVDMIEIGEMA